ncbi:MAG: hypothetical protein IPI53_17330 [Saprospiraceae bacterium]|nr:hypothetical protein [Saprospiraceae bacterium]
MEFISEVKIEQIIQKYEETDNFEKDLNELKNENPLLLEFISEERLELLKKEEQSLLEFMTVVIYSATKSSINNIPKIKGLVLEEAEEKIMNSGRMQVKSLRKLHLTCILMVMPKKICLHLWKTAYNRTTKTRLPLLV